MIKIADWIVDLGLEGGDGGGHIIAASTPEDIDKVKESYTRQYLRSFWIGARRSDRPTKPRT